MHAEHYNVLHVIPCYTVQHHAQAIELGQGGGGGAANVCLKTPVTSVIANTGYRFGN
jgi:hypothetical protein